MRKKFLKSVLIGALATTLVLGSPLMSNVSLAATEDVVEETSEEIVTVEDEMVTLEDEISLEDKISLEDGVFPENGVFLENEEPVEVSEEESPAIETFSADDKVEVYAATGVAINAKNFPDKAFREYVAENIDKNGDKVLSQAEISDCQVISCSGSGISDLTGINTFYNLITLVCENNNLTTLDVSKCTKLKYLDCYKNKISSLNVSGCADLQFLVCVENKLKSLSLSKNTALEILYCYNNQLTSLDLSKNTKLIFVNCSHNKLTSLDVSKCKDLEYLYAIGNNITNVDTKNNTKLDNLALLNTPTIKTPTKVSAGVKISWSKSIGADGYYIYRREAGASWKRLAEVKGVDTLSYVDKTTSNNKVYEYTIRGYWDDYGDIFLSDYEKNGKSITLGTPTLTTPKLSSVENVNGGVKISWGKVAGAAKYRVYYKTGSGKWTKIADTTSTSYTWKKAKSGTKYTFTVRCLSSDGKSFTSNYNKTGKSITYIAAPKLSSVSNTSTGVKISWGKVTGAKKYRVYYKTGSGKWTKIADTTSTSYTWKKAKSGTKYTFTVRCLSSDGKSFTSSYDSKGKSITYVAAPKLSSVSNTSTGVKISWGKVTGAAKYRVYYKTSNGSWTKIADTTSTSYTWKGAKKGTTYTFTVRCLSSDGKSFTSSYDSTGKKITYTGK